MSKKTLSISKKFTFPVAIFRVWVDQKVLLWCFCSFYFTKQNFVTSSTRGHPHFTANFIQVLEPFHLKVLLWSGPKNRCDEVESYQQKTFKYCKVRLIIFWVQIAIHSKWLINTWTFLQNLKLLLLYENKQTGMLTFSKYRHFWLAH